MITIIAKKIDSKLSRNETNYDRMDALVKYCANPQSKSETEKCVAVRAINFSDDEPSIDRIIDEFTFDMRKSRRQEIELISHWVVSWKGGEPHVNEIFDSAKRLLEDLGYTEANKVIFAIHADTGHIHCHIAVSKVDMWTGKINGEAWYKNEAQKSLARIADKYHWSLEPGARYRVKPDARKETLSVKTTQGIRKYERKIVTKCKIVKPSLAAGAKKYEHRTGLKSAQRQLQERLANFLEQNKSEISMWKYGNFHRELANRGIECKRVLHKNEFYTAFSLDGENFFAASKICPELSYDNLNKLLGGKSWRDARPDIISIRDDARKRHQEELELLTQTHFTSEEIARLRSIPAEKIYASLGKKPKTEKADALSLLASQGMKTQEALTWLAEKFPPADRAIENPGNEHLNKALAEGAQIVPRDMPRMRRISEFMAAMRTDQLIISTALINSETREKAAQAGDDISELNCRGVGLHQLARLLPQIEKLERYGISVSCRPVWKDRPPVILATDPEGRYFKTNGSFLLPSINNDNGFTVSILGSGRKTTIKAAVKESLLTEIKAKDVPGYVASAQMRMEPASEKAPYRPYEIEKEPLSDQLLKIYQREQALLLTRHLDAEQRAWVLAGALYCAGATPGQVYQALGGNAQAKQQAQAQMPASFTGSQSAWRRMRTDGKPEPNLDQVDYTKDRIAPDAKTKTPIATKEQKNAIK